jgi:hypothetical protein
MKLFISYAHEQCSVAEEVNASLAARGFDVFFDRAVLRGGAEYDERIKAAVEDSEVLVFLVSPESVSPGSYTLTELGIRKTQHPNPSGTALPVMVKPTLLKHVDPYLRAVTILYPLGNVAAEVSAAIDNLSKQGSASTSDSLSTHYSMASEMLYRERIPAYRPLWELTCVLPTWPKAENVQYEDLRTFRDALRHWYFTDGGGLFLSRDAHSAYYAIQNALTAVLREGRAGAILDEHYDAIRELCSALRTQLATAIGSRE